MKYSFKKLLILGIVAELIIFLISYFLHSEIEETFRYAARYSGRVSLAVFIYSFYLFAFSYPKPFVETIQLQNFIKLFATLHVIHFCFLATNVYLNSIELVPVKVLGGFIAYLMIIIAPFRLYNVSFFKQLIYFYYVSLVMILTYLARVKGDFEGAEPFWFHYFSLIVLILCCVVFGWMLYKSSLDKSKTI
jgi:hypothetical protein